MTKPEEKAEVLKAFFASVFNSKTSCPQGTQDGEQNETLIIQSEIVSDLLYCLVIHKFMGPHGMHPKIEEAS